MFVLGIIGLPFSIISKKWAYKFIKIYCLSCFLILRLVSNIKVECRGKIPTNDVLICSKHMSFLDKSSLVVDAVLTKLGRERLSQNNFVVAKFALGDDEVDYKLYNESNTQGPNNYGIVIENMPIHQAFLSTDLALKYKLVTQDIGSQITPELGDSVPDEITVTGEGDITVLNPSTVGGG